MSTLFQLQDRGEVKDFEFPDGTLFYVTGKYVNSHKNFPVISTENLRHALSINLWRGNVWYRLPGSSSRQLLFNVHN